MSAINRFSGIDSEYYLNAAGRYHREDGPALIHDDGRLEWFLNGIPHREDGPARLWKNGSEEWISHGKYHRTDGPAKIWKFDIFGINLQNQKYWYVNGIDISYEVNIWMKEHKISWPFTKENLIEFKLRWT